MSAEPVYEIARYGVRTENEVLIERARNCSARMESCVVVWMMDRKSSAQIPMWSRRSARIPR
jgi:hypothetical protein